MRKTNGRNLRSSYSLSVPTGTVVLRNDGELVTLQGAVFVDYATKTPDGGYIYKVGGTSYFVSGGCCTATKTLC